jgi:phosphoribosylanthranilate isomerase
MNIKLKICGMRNPANIAEVAGLQPDYMGFIFYDKSPRYVGEDFEMPGIPTLIKKVGVFVHEETAGVTDKAERYKLDFVQLHGNESVGQCRELKEQGLKIIKVFSIDNDFDFNAVKPYADFVTYCLFDTKGKYFGGNATTFDWTLLQKYDQQIPFFLSGGISGENVSALKELNNTNLHSIDVNSGVEISSGLKDADKIKELKRVVSSW